jgi:hypothetical protein
MKVRKLKKRGVIRYFKDNENYQLWRFKAGKMERINPETNGWVSSTRSPEKITGHYEGDWHEIPPNMAKYSFPDFFKLKNNEIQSD